MGRGRSSNLVRRANRAVERGNGYGGNKHSRKKGAKWTRKDVLETRKSLLRTKTELTEDGFNTAMMIEKSLKTVNKSGGLLTAQELL